MSLRLPSRGKLSIFALLLIVAGCSGGTDDATGDGDGDGGSTATGGDSATGGMGSGGMTDSGGSPAGDGGAPTDLEPSGTIELEFNGTPVTFDVWQAKQFGGTIGLILSGDSDNDDVFSVSLSIKDPVLGVHDCTASSSAEMVVSATNTEGESDSFEARGQGTCTINVIEHGGPGLPIRGTFSADVATFLDEKATVTNGRFDIIEGSSAL